jgi:hypothetical protein
MAQGHGRPLCDRCTCSSACRRAVRSLVKAPHFDPALVQKQQRRIAALDSVVRSINTDWARKLWRWAQTLPDAKVGQQQVECEYGRLMQKYGAAAF